MPELMEGLGTPGRTIERGGEGWPGSAPLPAAPPDASGTVSNEAGDSITNRIDETVPANARVWDRWLGGKDNFEVDRRVANQIATMFPLIPEVARADRAFLGRAVRFLARDAGIRQFLDIGTGLPAANNTHQVAQRIAPDARVVYVDHDAIVLAHARILLTGWFEGWAGECDLPASPCPVRSRRPSGAG